MATKREVILYQAENATGDITGEWVELSDSVKNCFVVVKAGTRNAGSYSVDIETSPENGTPNAPVDIVTNLVLNDSNLIRISDQTAKTFAKYARAVLTHTTADFDDVVVYLQYQ
jgi:hypothetical protein